MSRFRQGQLFPVCVYDGDAYDGTDTPVCTATTAAYAKEIVEAVNYGRDHEAVKRPGAELAKEPGDSNA
jgi:hypothetical protein